MIPYHRCRTGNLGVIVITKNINIIFPASLSLSGIRPGIGRTTQVDNNEVYMCASCKEVIKKEEIIFCCSCCGKFFPPEELRYIISQSTLVCLTCKKTPSYVNYRSILVSRVLEGELTND